MTELEFEKCLREALEQAAMEEAAPFMAAGETAAPPWSGRYLRRRRKLLADPFGCARRAARPAWRRALAVAGKAAACLVLAGSVTLAVSPAARAWTTRILRSWFPDYVSYDFTQSIQPVQTQAALLRPAYLPEGYELTDTFEPFPGYGALTYKKPGVDDGINFSYCFIRIVSGSPGFDNEHSDLTSAQVNGVPADLYVSNTPGYPSILIWTDEQETVLFSVFGPVEPEELLRIAESVEAVE